MKEIIGFIGLGIMGGGMVRNLLKAGFEVHVWNRTSSRMAPIEAAGANGAPDAATVAARSDIIILCVSETRDVEEVLFGENGVVHGANAGSLIIDTSTISPQATVSMEARLHTAGLRMLDAPISGGSEGAANGTLSIMVGGDKSDVKRAMGALEAMASRITHVGGTGAGQMVKLVNQILVVGTMMAISEALLFAQKGGLDLAKTLEAVEHGAAGSWMLSNRGTQAIVRDFEPGFTIDLQQKDLRLVLEAADALGIPLPMTGQIFQLYRSLQERGLGGEGNHALIMALENLAGVQIGTPD
ncbi:MAG: NAD(P)-dependent oxidoreductase [Rhodothermaceae bacterium]|nr:NAD(P)-dependent oxidoreductase [Rhodothermaceae bacterium]MXZ57378.1 NAD(P)-dependent oxidoreductase [Rhodothermaceae bacterium]MYB90583.1 NAD(P)-dependent oxidoreductase [Rhodothermaceae bacterium]MYD68331.1 NAD(P)-dependent oxidoreductase [Rhodothermaceae bacterium]MYG44320.1 NAD(P)-dependent oxidoreductase [Rhodothermaceae bacterium]